MEDVISKTLIFSSALLVLYCVLRVVHIIWWRPKSLGKQLKQQGIRGTSYKLLCGDMKEIVRVTKEAWSKPMTLNHQIVPRVQPFYHEMVQKYGKHFIQSNAIQAPVHWNLDRRFGQSRCAPKVPVHRRRSHMASYFPSIIPLLSPREQLRGTHTVPRHFPIGKTGKISVSWIETRPRLIIVDPELIRLVLTDKDGHFQKPPLNPLVDLLQLGVSTLEGEKWAKRRRLITPAFHLEKLKGMVPAFSTSCCNLIDRWKKLVSPQGSYELDIAPEFQNLAGDVIARTAFGSNYEEGKKIFELQKEQAVLVLEAAQNIYIPGFRFIPTKKNRRRYNLDNKIKATLRDMIFRKEQAMRNGELGNNNDLLGLLLQCKEQSDNGMTIEDVIEECKLFYFAGQETTANWLTWTIILLSMHPNWQEKAREEVLQICGKKTPDIETINHLKIVSMILHEVLRLYPPVTALFRHTHQRTNVGGLSIPAGVDILLPTLLLQYDPEYWGEDVEEFKPERFAQGVSNASKDQIAFYPFGRGPRICLGQNFAMIEAKMALAMVLQHFWFELSPSYTHAPCTIITLQPQHGAPIILHQI